MLDHIRNSINQKNKTQNNEDNYILLDKIETKGKKYQEKTVIDNKVTNRVIQGKNNNITQNKKNKTANKKLKIPNC